MVSKFILSRYLPKYLDLDGCNGFYKISDLTHPAAFNTQSKDRDGL